MQWLYSLGILSYRLAIGISSLFNQKAKFWIAGRKNWLSELIKADVSGAIWFHCASLGEFEQGRPLIEAIKKNNPNQKILLTFFSPSGYEIRKNYALADFVSYLPLDTKKNAKAFLKVTDPEMAIFIKYEIWHNFYRVLNEKNIPHYLVSAIFRDNQVYFGLLGKWFRKSLEGANHIFTQDQHSLNLLQSFDVMNSSIAGDTRFDRVWDISKAPTEIPEIKKFTQSRMSIVAGSTWKSDEIILSDVADANKDLRLIIAPHEIHSSHLEELKSKFPQAVFWTEKNLINQNTQVLIIDKIGLLSSIYGYGDIAYVGGGFGSGIHNSLEPAAYGIPVIFGPNYEKFKEAKDLIKVKGGFSISSSKECQDLIKKLFDDKSFKEQAGNASGTYVENNTGATSIILKEIMN